MPSGHPGRHGDADLEEFEFVAGALRAPVSAKGCRPTALWNEIQTIEGEREIAYVTSVERLEVQRGLQQGEEKGRVEGRMEGQADRLTRQLTKRFGTLSAEIQMSAVSDFDGCVIKLRDGCGRRCSPRPRAAGVSSRRREVGGAR